MDENRWAREHFEEHRGRLRGLAYRMLGSLSEADDAVQETWMRASRFGIDDIENPGGWLTTTTARVCLNMLRSRQSRPLDLQGVHLPDPVVSLDDRVDPEAEALLADAVGLALLVVFDKLTPAERLAFVLHDMFAVPFDDIAPIVDRSVDATRQLASRARRRVQSADAASDSDIASQREIVDAFFGAARRGDLEGLVAVLDPEVMLRSDGGAQRPELSVLLRGSAAIAGQALRFANPAATLRPVVVNGSAGVLITIGDQPISLMAFTVARGKIVAIDALADPDRLERFRSLVPRPQ